MRQKQKKELTSYEVFAVYRIVIGAIIVLCMCINF